LEPIPLIIHPVLMKCFLKFDIASQPLNYDFGLPTEDIFSSAVHPPVQILILENEEGFPQNIEVRASDNGSRIGVTVGDVLKAISVDLRTSCSQRELATLVRREVGDAFEDWARTEERTSGLRPKGYLYGRNKLSVLPKYPFPKDDEIAQPLPFNWSRRIFPFLFAKTQGTSIVPKKKRRALLVGISYAHIQSDTWWPLENPHQDVDLFRNLLVGE
jgi:hypothetical protein